MHKAAPRHALIGLLWSAFFACGHVSPALAAGVQINLIAADGRPVADAVATATPIGAVPKRPRERKSTAMDQLNKAFVPQVLVVESGTSVDFPNNDSVSHQVYSFSPARKFQLSLYKGELHAPVQFDTPGLVVLGCNIHDSMVGYIYVADTPYFGKTDRAGILRLDQVPRGRYRIQVWSPSIADEPGSMSKDLEVEESGESAVSFRLRKPLRSVPQPRPHPEGWDAY